MEENQQILRKINEATSRYSKRKLLNEWKDRRRSLKYPRLIIVRLCEYANVHVKKIIQFDIEN